MNSLRAAALGFCRQNWNMLAMARSILERLHILASDGEIVCITEKMRYK